ncbi:hypothetical protein [Flavobacterium sp. CF136]|uniref:hypothetical protein n=1 Tax=Flavobacterium sp. (strain CF136) TaxID=1144313 RepID=UPI000271C93C|nr:hypothetical protein [Flavobacterium sp. CF136]EJL66645.1 hypothetical protein PMI10_00223 [Flavobacterium sp. CF136]
MYLNLILFTTEAMLTAKNANNSKVKRIKESEALKVKQFEEFVGLHNNKSFMDYTFLGESLPIL